MQELTRHENADSGLQRNSSTPNDLRGTVVAAQEIRNYTCRHLVAVNGKTLPPTLSNHGTQPGTKTVEDYHTPYRPDWRGSGSAGEHIVVE